MIQLAATIFVVLVGLTFAGIILEWISDARAAWIAEGKRIAAEKANRTGKA